MQNFWKSVKIWQSYREFEGRNFFWDTVQSLHGFCQRHSSPMRTMRPMWCFVRPIHFLYFVHHNSAERHIFGGAHPRGLWPTNSNSGEIIVQCIYPLSFIIPCLLVQKLSCWQINEQMPLKTSNALRYATTLGKNDDNNAECWLKSGMWYVLHAVLGVIKLLVIKLLI